MAEVNQISFHTISFGSTVANSDPQNDANNCSTHSGESNSRYGGAVLESDVAWNQFPQEYNLSIQEASDIEEFWKNQEQLQSRYEDESSSLFHAIWYSNSSLEWMLLKVTNHM